MPSLLISANEQCVVSINGSFLGLIRQGDEKNIPLSTGQSLFVVQPVEALWEPLVCIIENSGEPHCICGGVLSRWSEEIYCLRLELFPKRVSPPPLLMKEEKWGDGFAGLCGDCFVFEDSLGNRSFIDEPVEDFVILSKKFVLLKQQDSLCVIDRALNKVIAPVPCENFRIENNGLILSFVPWNMDCFTLEERYSLEDLSLIKSDLTFLKRETPLDLVRSFCQCVRLSREAEALELLTPSLKREFSFQSIKDFLGPFDACESVRFISSPANNTLALRYKIDRFNYHFLCYELSVDASSGTPLIDDVSQL